MTLFTARSNLSSLKPLQRVTATVSIHPNLTTKCFWRNIRYPVPFCLLNHMLGEGDKWGNAAWIPLNGVIHRATEPSTVSINGTVPTLFAVGGEWHRAGAGGGGVKEKEQERIKLHTVRESKLLYVSVAPESFSCSPPYAAVISRSWPT